MSSDAYTVVVGLETHVQLKTKAKLFCGCSTEFGAPPNTQTCPVCIGMPGTLPVLNREAFHLSLRTAAALNCEIATFTKWDRKNYYYPDLPKAYQISQFDLPFSSNGSLTVATDDGESMRTVRIRRAHLEEDAGKSMHDEAAGRADSRIDLNRTGTPLLEIVTEPDLRSGGEAKRYLEELKLVLTYLGVSDCNMQEGSLRVDANVNLHVDVDGETIATPIVEVKNMNSFRAVERAIAFESDRQYEEWKTTGHRLGDVAKSTRGWDDDASVTRPQRHKEESSDYRYFPDPDLVPVTVTESEIAAVHAALPELPAKLRSRLVEESGLTEYDSDVLVNQGRALIDYYFVVSELCGDAKLASNWIQQQVLRILNEQQIEISDFAVSAEELGNLLVKIRDGELDGGRGRDVLEWMIEHRGSADEGIAALGIEHVDESALEALCRELLDANPKIVADIQAGKAKAAGALIGQAKKKNPNVDPARVRELCLEIASKL